MKLKRFSRYIAVPSRVFVTIVILLFIIVMLQLLVAEIFQQRLLYRIKTEAMTQVLSEQEKKARRIGRSAKNFLADGTIHLVYQPEQQFYKSEELREVEIYDVNDNLLWRGIKKDFPYEYLSWSARFRNTFSENSMKESQIITAEFSHSFIIPVGSTEGVIRQVWRYEPKLQYFKGYEVGGSEIGYIGAGGFSDKKSEAKPLGKLVLLSAWTPKNSLEPRCIWQTGRRIYEIDFGERKVELLFESSEAKIVGISMQNWGGLESEITEKSTIIKYRPYILCRTEDRNFHLIMQNPPQKLTFQIPEDWVSALTDVAATEQDVYIHRLEMEGRPRDTDDRRQYLKLIDSWLSETYNKPIRYRVEIYKLDEKGGFEFISGYDWVRPVYSSGERTADYVSQSLRYVNFVSPLLYDVLWNFFGRDLWFILRDYDSEFIKELAYLIGEFRPKFSIIHLLLNFLMVGFVFWHGLSRRTRWGRFVFWLIFVGLFNLAGLLTYLALNHTAVIKCPLCGRRRGLGRVDCVRCGSELPVPKRRELDLIFG